MVTQETIIYRLAVRNYVLMLFLKEILFLAGTWAWPPRWRQGVWDLKTRPKSWPDSWNFWVNCYLENMFSKFSGLNPSPKVSCDWYILTKFPGYVEHRRTFSPQILIHIWTSLIFAYSNHFYVAHSMDMNLCPLLIRKINWAHFDEKCQSYGQFMANWMFVTNTTRKNSN